jgi:serine/threonine protein kinase
MCRDIGLVPSSCILSKKVIASETVPCKSGFSDVWKGILDDREVALKVLRLHSDDIQLVKKVCSCTRSRVLQTYGRQAYVNELIVWQCLRHPNIVPFIGALQLHEISLVSEWMSGGTVIAFLLANPDHDRAKLVRLNSLQGDEPRLTSCTQGS